MQLPAVGKVLSLHLQHKKQFLSVLWAHLKTKQKAADTTKNLELIELQGC